MNEIRTQITEILASLMDMTEEEKEDTLRMLEELKKQAEAIKKRQRKLLTNLKNWQIPRRARLTSSLKKSKS